MVALEGLAGKGGDRERRIFDRRDATPGAGDDDVSGDAGTDTVSYADASGAVAVDLRKLLPQDTLRSGDDALTGLERLVGSRFADRLTGSNAANLIRGGAGNDRLFGLGGVDKLYGDAGNDLVDGGAGTDACSGGTGKNSLKSC